MINYNKKKITISVSIQKFKSKPDNWKTLTYKRYTISIEELIKLICKGHCICQNFKTASKTFGVKEKTIDNFDFADCVILDIDDTFLSINDFYLSLKDEHKPTIIYTTYSNIDNINNRFRLIYIFNEPIRSNEYYRGIANTIVYNIQKEIEGFDLKDKTCLNASQQFAGNGNDNIVYYYNDNIFCPTDFGIDEKYFSNSKSILRKERKNNIQTDLETPIGNSEFMKDFWSTSYKKNEEIFIRKYAEIYPFLEATPLPETDSDIPYILLPDNYVKIARYWYKEPLTKSDGTIVYKSHAVKLKPGHRRKLLYDGCLLRKIMLPKITVEHLLYSLVCERRYYVDNQDKVITNKILYQIAKDAWNDTERSIKPKKEKKQFVVNPKFCEKYGISKQAARNIAVKMLLDLQLKQLYDTKLSIKENLESLKNQGIKIGKSSLYNWVKSQKRQPTIETPENKPHVKSPP